MGSSLDLHDRIRGCLLGGAIGDAMGGPYEGRRGPLAYEDHSEWRLSDDTQLTWATCEAIIGRSGVDAEQIAARMLAWFRERRIDGVGASSLKALRDLDAGAHWALSGASGERSAGNGAAMRVAPLAFVLDPEDLSDRTVIRDVCRITHHNDEAYVGALAVMAAIRCGAAENLWLQVRNVLPDSRVRDRVDEFSRLPQDLAPCEVSQRFGASGYVSESVPLSLYAAQRIANESFESVLRLTIEAGGDTDTLASMTGQIVGSWIGVSGVGADLIERLPRHVELASIADQLADVSFEERERP